jgi:hypothetical protein
MGCSFFQTITDYFASIRRLKNERSVKHVRTEYTIEEPFLEESQITTRDNPKLGVELCEQTVGVALKNQSGLRFYGNERHGSM